MTYNTLMTSIFQKKLHDWLSGHSNLSNIHAKIRELSRLNTLLQQALEPPLNHYCRLANYRDNILIIQADSAAWATRLRYCLPFLIQNLKALAPFKDLMQIDIHVYPFLPTSFADPSAEGADSNTGKASIQHRLSQQSAALLTETADNTSDEALAKALKKLAENK